MSTEYLFECSEMDVIPKSLLEAIAIINSNSRSTPLGCFRKEEVEEEVGKNWRIKSTFYT
jgi:hypothetical protein